MAPSKGKRTQLLSCIQEIRNTVKPRVIARRSPASAPRLSTFSLPIGSSQHHSGAFGIRKTLDIHNVAAVPLQPHYPLNSLRPPQTYSLPVSPSRRARYPPIQQGCCCRKTGSTPLIWLPVPDAVDLVQDGARFRIRRKCRYCYLLQSKAPQSSSCCWCAINCASNSLTDKTFSPLCVNTPSSLLLSSSAKSTSEKSEPWSILKGSNSAKPEFFP